MAASPAPGSAAVAPMRASRAPTGRSIAIAESLPTRRTPSGRNMPLSDSMANTWLGSSFSCAAR